jgi:uncharacterized membrane protein YeaQ/YmgE (transglycosylase-associated protein family)
MDMPDTQMTLILQQSVNDVLVWVGFGTLCGLCAKAIMPGTDPGGAVATMMLGMAGSIVGCGTLLFFIEGARVTPISPVGFAAATIGGFVLLFFYRLLSGSFFTEAEDGERFLYRSSRGRRRKKMLENA